MERGALNSELDGNPAERRATWSREDPRFLDIVYQSPFINKKNCAIMLISKGFVSPVVPLKWRKVIYHIAPSFSHGLCMRA